MRDYTRKQPRFTKENLCTEFIERAELTNNDTKKKNACSYKDNTQTTNNPNVNAY